MRYIGVLLVLVGCGVDLERDPFDGACGPAPGGESAALRPLGEGDGLVLSLGVEFGGSSSIDALDATLGTRASNRLVGYGDAALRPLGDQAVFINRGEFTKLQLIDGASAPGGEVSLGACNPHDVAWLDDCRALVSCYDAPVMQIVDLATGEVSDGPDLSGLADADGIPEADQITRVGDSLLVSLQRLDREAFYAPTGPGWIAELDATTLALRDREPQVEGVQALTLPCQNPFTDFAAMPQDRVAIACFGDFVDPSTHGVAVVDLATGTTELVADGATLGGPPSALRVDAQGRALVLVSWPDAFVTEEMRLLRLSPDGAEVLHTSPGFSLSGLAVSADGTIYFGNRSATEDAGLWALQPNGALFGPVATSLPPYEIEVW